MGEASSDDPLISTEYLSSIYPPVEVLLEGLKLPSDLIGNTVLEVFSGPPDATMKSVIEQRGGQYYSVDLLANAPAGERHVIADAWRLPFAPDTFNYVLMEGPSIWGRFISKFDRLIGRTHSLSENAVDMFEECLRVLKKKSGSFVAVTAGFHEKDIRFLRKKISSMPSFTESEVFFRRTAVPQSDDWGRLVPGKFSYSMKIVHR